MSSHPHGPIVADPEVASSDVEYTLAEPETTATPQSQHEGPEPSESGFDKAELERYGWVPLYRHWVETAWWWESKPWSLGQVFLYLLAKANRSPRQARHLLEIISIPRGGVATSFSKLAGRTGLNRKTVTKYLNLLAKAGELEFLRRDKHGIVVRVCRYDLFALDHNDKRQHRGQRGGQQHSPQRHKAPAHESLPPPSSADTL